MTTPSPLRTALRSRLTTSLRERDRATATVLRTAIAALENAEAVPTDGTLAATTSSRVAGTAVGVGAAEAERRVLTHDEERALVEVEVDALHEAREVFDRAGDATRAAQATAAAQVLTAVLAEAVTG